MAKLEGQSIASSYEQLLHVDRDGGGNTTTLVDVKDGKNTTTFALNLATDKAEIDGNLYTLAGNLTTQNNNVTINAAGAARTITLNESLTIGDGNDGTLTFSAGSKT